MPNKKTILFIAYFFFFISENYGQFKPSDTLVHLTYFNQKEFRNKKLLLNKVVVVDNRMDCSRIIGIVVSDKGTPIQLNFDTTTTAAIEIYIAKIAEKISKNSGKLIISLHRYQEFGHKNFLFSADAYLGSAESGFIKISSIDTLYNKHSIDFMRGKAIDDFIININSEKSFSDSLILGKKFTTDEINNDKINKQWIKYNIVKENSSNATGVYLSYWRFRDNILDTANLQLTMNPDSTYKLIVLDNSRETKQKIFRWSEIPRIPLRYKGSLFVKLYDVIVPMNAENNTFYFRIPPNYPDMFTYALSYQAFSNFGGTNNPSNLQDVGNTILAKKISKSILNQEKKSTDLRSINYDMESGIMIYR
ncbi:MAG TPA: hypothetical protein VK787_14175 [Puia sp.]|jgi:hypothetical protein|nr:hypothetical protein [Puia sp.]